MPETAFVTGGTGFVGGAIVERLVSTGCAVKALTRSDDGARTLRALGAEPVRGDVLDRRTLLEAMRGCGVVYHAAGVNAFCLRDTSPLFDVNVRGSVNAVHAAADAGVRRIVYTSSAATLGEERGSEGSESSPHRGSFLSELRALEVRGGACSHDGGPRAGNRGRARSTRLLFKAPVGLRAPRACCSTI